MKAVWLIARRELGNYVNSLWGYLVAMAILVIDGLLFTAFALSEKPRLSAAVLSDFFYLSFGTTVVASILLTMRLIAEERQTGTIVLIDASPFRDWQIVAGKYLSAMIFLGVMTLLTAYMPALIAVNGKVSAGHIFTGYLGLFLVGSATVAIGTFASTVTRYQLVSAVIAAFLIVFLLLSWLLAKTTSPPFADILSYMSLYDQHFRGFQNGRINTRDVLYYLSVTFVFLMLSTRWLSARRWQ